MIPSGFGPPAPFSVVGSTVLDSQMVVLAARLGGHDPCRGGDLIGIGYARGIGIILSGLGCDHQRVVALDLQLTAVAYGIVAQVGIEANVPARRRVLVAHRFVRGVPHKLVQTGDGDQLIPIQIGRASCRERV